VPAKDADWVLWGSELSPYALKVEACLRFAGVPYRWLPASGSFREAFRFESRRRSLVSGRLPLSWPRKDPLDELPLVPFLFGPGGENLYDSSAIGEWLDTQWPGRQAAALIPDDDRSVRFVVRLIDEALDEVGLYLVHHNRWVVAAGDNDAGIRLAREFRPLLGPFAMIQQRAFPARQVRRLPYLFSVAPERSTSFDGLPPRLRPPSRNGFPATHELLERMFSDLLSAVEPVLEKRPFLLGERFTLADASLYGQLGMNRTDPSACAWIRREAPSTQAWIDRLARGDFDGHQGVARLVLDASIAPLLAWICRTFVPLMRQNQAAYERHRAAGVTRFNEAAFDAGRALYDGELCGQPFRSVAKSFQARVWRDLRGEWDALTPAGRARIEKVLPAGQGLDRDEKEGSSATTP
jgi:glutathione S-transferase